MTGTLGNRSDDAINDRRPPERAPPTSFHRATYDSLGMVRPEAVVMAPSPLASASRSAAALTLLLTLVGDTPCFGLCLVEPTRPLVA